MRVLVLTTAILAGLLLAATACAPVTATDNKTGPVVKTAEGPVTGLVRNGVFEFRGIPYAAPPVGKWRWMPPQPVAKWKEPRDATHSGNICAQSTTLVFLPVRQRGRGLPLPQRLHNGARQSRHSAIWRNAGDCLDSRRRQRRR